MSIKTDECEQCFALACGPNRDLVRVFLLEKLGLRVLRVLKVLRVA